MEKPLLQNQFENKIVLQNKTCTRVLTNGERKGKVCGKESSKDDRCWFHRVQTPTKMDLDGYITSDEENYPEPDMVFCNIILKHGKYEGFRCGNMCEKGTELCTYHHRVNY